MCFEQAQRFNMAGINEQFSSREDSTRGVCFLAEALISLLSPMGCKSGWSDRKLFLSNLHKFADRRVLHRDFMPGPMIE
jgi:hypothetical protein